MICCTRASQRGLAMPMVLAVIFIVFLLGSAASTVCINNARLVEVASNQARVHEAAMAGQMEVQCLLNQSSDWSSGITLSGVEEQPDSNIPVFYTLSFQGAPSQTQCVVVSTAYLKDSGGHPYANESLRVYWQRDQGAFRYGVQAKNSVTLAASSVNAPTTTTTLPNSTTVTGYDTAVRTNSTLTGAVTMDSASNVGGDVMVGQGGNSSAVNAPSSTQISGQILPSATTTNLVTKVPPFPVGTTAITLP